MVRGGVGHWRVPVKFVAIRFQDGFEGTERSEPLIQKNGTTVVETRHREFREKNKNRGGHRVYLSGRDSEIFMSQLHRKNSQKIMIK